jgi:ketosteroid isomerase-like protein
MPNATANENLSRNFIEKVFKEVIENIDADEKTISQYFSPDYIQHVDGYKLNYENFVQHMMVQKSLLTYAKITIEHCVIEGNAICTVHKVDAIKKNGNKIAIKVIAYFEIEAGKIILCDELTFLLNGEDEDQNIGSIK